MVLTTYQVMVLTTYQMMVLATYQVMVLSNLDPRTEHLSCILLPRCKEGFSLTSHSYYISTSIYSAIPVPFTIDWNVPVSIASNNRL